MFLFCNLPAKVQSLYRNRPIRHHLLYFFYLKSPIMLAEVGMRSHKAMLLVAKSNAFRRWEQCSWMLGAMLSGAGSIAFGVQKQCSTPFKAMILAQERPASIIRKQAFLLLPPYWGGLGWGFTSPPPSSH